ncbi:hypothetical protein [Mycolicibacterium goodii]|uniref:hypothetical protein n=1 Tax=Mycolicibacterium goodii TaxID=134601 RepID=UPI0013042277|nr:hypothetical protein [Mycolicibacterium goodii]
MFFTQAGNSPGSHIVGIADFDVTLANAALDRCGWPAARYTATSFDGALINVPGL